MELLPRVTWVDPGLGAPCDRVSFIQVLWLNPARGWLSLVCGVGLVCQIPVGRVQPGSVALWGGRVREGAALPAVCEVRGGQLRCRPARLCSGETHAATMSLCLQCGRKDRTTAVVLSYTL